MKVKVGARASPLSCAQFEEIREELSKIYPHIFLDPVWVETIGDRDRTTSLRTLGKTDFFTRELDQMLLAGAIQVAIHSAKDLPEPMPKGLAIIALTRGVDPRDSLVMREGAAIHLLSSGSWIAASSERREKAVQQLRPDLRFVDVRGTIGERLEKLFSKKVDGVVIAEAAIIRLGLSLNRLVLEGETAPLQGRLAVVAREGDRAAQAIFSSICAGPHDSLFRP